MDCARCERKMKKSEPKVLRDAPPYQGVAICEPCDESLCSGEVPPEPEAPSVADVIQEVRANVAQDSTQSITWGIGAQWALREIERRLGLPPQD